MDSGPTRPPLRRKADHFQAFANLACTLLTYRRLLKATNRRP